MNFVETGFNYIRLLLKYIFCPRRRNISWFKPQETVVLQTIFRVTRAGMLMVLVLSFTWLGIILHPLWPTNRKGTRIFAHPQYCNFKFHKKYIKLHIFSKIYYHSEFQEPQFSAAVVASTSQFSPAPCY